MKPKIGLIGLGQMGYAVARRLLAAECPLVIYNRTAAKAETLVQQGAILATSPCSLASEAGTVITIVSDDEALDAVVSGPNGVAVGIEKGAVLIDMSTLTPDAVEKTAKKLHERGAEMLHAPILGGPMNVYVGSATFTVGGREETVHRLRPLLEQICKPVIYTGPLTNGTYTKLALNIMLTHFMTGLANSLAFAGRAGVDQQLVLKIISRAAGHILERTGEKMLSGDESVTFTFHNLEKDQRYFLKAADKLGLSLPTIEAVQKLLAKANTEGWEEEDFTAFYRYIQKE